MTEWGYASELDDVRGEVAIVGIGETAYTKASGRTAREIGAEAAERAIADAGSNPPTSTASPARARSPTSTSPRSTSTSAPTHEMWSSPWGGGMALGRAPRPYLAAQAIREGKARHVLNVFPVAWATQRGSMTGGPGEVHAAQSLKQNLEVPVRLVPAARVLRLDHAPAHARVRHDRGAVRRGRGRVPARTRTCTPTR